MFKLRSGGAPHVPARAGFGLLAACAVLAAIGAAILDDYGISVDEETQRWIAELNWRHALGEAEPHFDLPADRFYGVAFELPVLLAEKALGLEDWRHIHLLRHAASHLLFLAGALCCGLLARRMTGSAALALFAFVLFVLQPRLYAHSFFNSKDVPALALFAACLWLAHRAFRRGGAGAFLLCGAGAAVLTNLRIPAGLAFLAAVLAARVLDLALASGPAARRRVLASLAALAAGWAGVLYAVSPYMWADGPGAFIDAVDAFARHPNLAGVLFQGRAVSTSDLPAHYFAAWFAISTPPVLLVLGLTGFTLALRRGLARPVAALRNTPARFALLAAACWAGPPLASALAGANAYDGWRHMFFIHAPFCVLAALGAAALARAARRLAKRRGKAALGALAGAGVAAAGVSTALLHPHQQVYFNGLEDRATPWRLRERYDFGYWGPAARAALERALAERAGAEARICGAVDHAVRNTHILRRADRARVSAVATGDGCDFAFSDPRQAVWKGNPGTRPVVPPAWSAAAWGSSFSDLFDMDAVRAARRRWRDAAASRPPDIAARFDVWIHDGMAIYARASCAAEDLAARFFLHIDPADPADLPWNSRRYGFDNRDFAPLDTAPAWPWPSWERRGEGCAVAAPLPDYPIRRVRTGQIVSDGGGGYRSLWEGEIDLAGTGRR